MPDDVDVTNGPLHVPHDPDATLASPELPPDATPAANSPTAKLPAAKTPSVIGRYRILRLLGEGGMGAVYEAEQGLPRRRVALKVIKAAWVETGDTIHRTERLGMLGSEHAATDTLATEVQLVLVYQSEHKYAQAEN